MSWQEYSIEEVCELIVDCVNRTAPVVDYETPYKMIRTSNVRDGWIDMSDARSVTKDTYENWTRRAVPRQGDVVLTREAPLGEVGLIRTDEPVFLGQRTVMYRANPEMMFPHFLYYSLLGHEVQAQIQAFGFGSTVSHMRVPDAKKLQLKAPDTATQEKIIHVLDAYDTIIEANQRRIKLLEEAARLLYREWFLKLRFPGNEDVTITDGVPGGWTRSSIASLCSLLNRGIAPQYNDTAKGLVINQKCIRSGRLTMDQARRQSREVKPERLVQLGDILINSTGAGTLGRVALVMKSIPACTVDTHITIARPAGTISQAFFGMALLNLEPVFSDMGKGSTNQLELSRGDIGNVDILLPEVGVQKEFHQLAWPLLVQAQQLIDANGLLQEARDMLLPKLMSGALDVSRIAVPKDNTIENLG